MKNSGEQSAREFDERKPTVDKELQAAKKILGGSGLII